MFDKRTLSELGGWTGYRVADLAYRPGEGWMGRGKLLIRLEPRGKTMHCSRCGRRSHAVHDTTLRRIRDLPMLDWDVVLIVPRRRLWCEHCGGPHLEALDWLSPHRRVTRRLEAAIGRLARMLPLKQVAAFYGVGWHTVKAIDKALLAQDVIAPDWRDIEYLGMDEHLDYYLERFEQQVLDRGGQVHWAATAEEAQRIVVAICQDAGARSVTKGKSMVGEEVGVNAALEAAGMEVVETGLGEYIIQLAKEPPSHIIAPAVHKTREQIATLFHEHHAKYGLTEKLSEIPDIVNEARQVLRDKYLAADVGITGANFLIAETGSGIIVTNEGNGDLTNTLPKVHIVTAGIEKVVPTLEDATTLLRLLARSATGQPITSYTTLFTGPRRAGDLDGPEQFHVVLVDNGRSAMLKDEFREMLRCIRCGACMNHCPVYGAIGGHAYGWVYPGPMGSVLTPLTLGLREAKDLPNACTLNGRCAEVCPVRIPLPDLLRSLRHRQFQHHIGTRRARWGLAVWGWLARRPRLYHRVTALQARFLRLLGGRRGYLTAMPLAGDWFRGGRVLPAPQGETFMAAWRRRGRGT